MFWSYFIHPCYAPTLPCVPSYFLPTSCPPPFLSCYCNLLSLLSAAHMCMGMGPFFKARVTWSLWPQRRVSLPLSNHPLCPVPPQRVVPPCGQNFDWLDFVQVSPDAVTDVCSRQTATPHPEFSILQHPPSHPSALPFFPHTVLWCSQWPGGARLIQTMKPQLSYHGYLHLALGSLVSLSINYSPLRREASLTKDKSNINLWIWT